MENKQKLKRPIQRIVRLSEEENNLIKRKIEESFFPNFQNFALHLLIQGASPFRFKSIINQILSIKPLGKLETTPNEA